MRKAVVLLVLAAFAVVALAVPAFAGSIDRVSPPRERTVTVVGKVVHSTISRPHYELVVVAAQVPPLLGPVARPPAQPAQRYVLTGPFNFKAYEGKLVQATGQVVDGPNIYMRGPILRVIRIIEPLPVAKDPAV